MVKHKRVHLVAVVASGLMVLAAGCAAASDAVVVVPAAGVDASGGQAAAGQSRGVVDGAVGASGALGADPSAAPTTTPPTTVAPTPVLTPMIVLPYGPAAVPAAQTPVPVPAIPPLSPVRIGQHSPAVAAVEQRLLQLGFWLDAADGRYSFVTAQAVMAYQKYTGLKRTGSADQATVARLSQAQNKVMSKATVGNLVEVDKAKQLLFVLRNGEVLWAVNTSTGSGRRYSATSKLTGKDASGVAVTPDGLHTIYRQDPNGWHKGDLGTIYRPKYFAGGAAIHGYPTIPAGPASHGCIRVSTTFMDFVWSANLVPIKSQVWVHEGAPTDLQPLKADD